MKAQERLSREEDEFVLHKTMIIRNQQFFEEFHAVLQA